MQLVKFPLGDGTYQRCTFIGVDSHGVATVKTQGGRYRAVWDCNLYPELNAEESRGERLDETTYAFATTDQRPSGTY